MWLFPSIAAVVALVFAVALARQYAVRRRPYQLCWALALLMYAAAAAALAVGAAASGGWSTGAYRVFWLFGAVLNVPYLAMGEVYLLVRKRFAVDALLLLLVFATAFALNRVRTATIAATALDSALPRGTRAWAQDPFVLDLARLYSYVAYGLLLAGTLWSAWRMRSSPELRDRFLGTLGVAVGATIVAAGSAFAAAGNLPGFSATITVGVAVMFWGFLRASRPSPRPVGETRGDDDPSAHPPRTTLEPPPAGQGG
jgi:hypothetical protein